MKIIFFANTDWYLYNFRLGLARFLRSQGAEVVMISPPGKYGSRFAEQGFCWIPLPMDRRSLNLINEFRLLWFIYRLYKQESPDIVHNFTIKSVVYGSLAAQAAGISSRVHAVTGLGHIFISQSFKARLLRPLVKLLLRLALRGADSRLILQNPDDRKLFLDLKLIKTQQLQLIKGSGVDTATFKPVQQNSSRQDRPFRVLLASRLLWEKGIKEYARAAALLAHRAGEIEFILAGAADSGNPSAVAETDIRKWQQSGLLRVIGHVDDMFNLMREVDLMVLPSYREGLPRGLLEAAAMGLPIITTDAPGCREIVEHGVNGMLVPVGAVRELAEAMEYLLDHPEVCAAYGRAGRKKVEAEFAQDFVFQQTWEVYLSLGVTG
jgi:glycosyltransferase involved in cell wall biosynthesis